MSKAHCTAWTNYADWQAAKLFPLAETLQAHRNQPYSDDIVRSMLQAAIRLQIDDDQREYAQLAEMQIRSMLTA